MRHWRRIVLVSAIGALLGATAIFFCPLPISLQKPAAGTLTLLDCRSREFAQIASADARVQLPRALNEMGPWLPRVTVALEDHRFYQHGAVDWRATAAAAVRDLQSGRIVSGGSTITQQLAKIGNARRGRSWLGKFREAIVACRLEQKWNKQEILAEYLNRSSYGNRRLGAEAAARAYFGKSAHDLTLAESIFLAGLPQAPTRFNPWTHPGAALQKYQRSITRLRELDLISPAQRQLLAKTPPIVRRSDPPRMAPHFVDAVLAKRPALQGAVRSSLDLDLQSMAERLLTAHLADLNRYDISQAAIVILDNETGAVRAMVGSGNYARNQINGATQLRSCGSTLKPFIYLDAIERRIFTAASLLPDTPDAIRGEFSDYDPQNYNHRYLGPVRLREALACSLNVPAVFTTARIGVRQTFFDLQKWGFEFPRQLSDYGAGFVLGNAEVRLTNLAGVYAGLARGGFAMETKFLTGDHHPMRRLASPEAVTIVTDILCDNDAREKSFGVHSPLAFSERIAVKTGTSSGFRDAWTVGFDKDHTVAVWAGNFDGQPMRDTLAVRSAAPLWAAIMHEMLGRGDHSLDPPRASERLTRQEVCATTGLVSSFFSSSAVNEWFLAETEPRMSSADWFSPEGKLLLPTEYAGWCASASNTDGAQVRSGVRIINPATNARYAIDSTLPRAQQMIELTATLGPEVRWFVNDSQIFPNKDHRFFWQLEAGEWKVRARSSAGAAEETIVVE